MACQLPEQELADFARTLMRFIALEGNDQALDLLGQLVGITHGRRERSLKAPQPYSLWRLKTLYPVLRDMPNSRHRSVIGSRMAKKLKPQQERVVIPCRSSYGRGFVKAPERCGERFLYSLLGARCLAGVCKVGQRLARGYRTVYLPAAVAISSRSPSRV